MQLQPAVSVIVPTCGRSGRCQRLLTALSDQNLQPANFEVVVVDDASDDGTTEMVEQLRPSLPYRVKALRLEMNSGPAVARNVGWRASDAKIIAFIDDDCVPDKNWLSAGLESMAADSNVGVVQGRTVPPAEYHTTVQPRWHHIQDLPTFSPYFEACNIFYRKAALISAGGFHEGISWWGEDTALGWEVLKQGWRRGNGSGSVVVHDVSERGWRWYVHAAWLERNLVGLSLAYPDFRLNAFWRSWAFHRNDVPTALAVLAIACALRWRPALLATLPYVFTAKTKPRGPRSLRIFIEQAVVDCTRLAGHVLASIEHGVFVL